MTRPSRGTLLLALAVAVAGCGGGDGSGSPFGGTAGENDGNTPSSPSPSPPSSSPTPANHTVAYTVTGNASAVGVTYLAADGTARQLETTLPFTFNVGNVAEGVALQLSAENRNASGSITASIVVDGATVLRTDTGTGGFVTVTVSADCC